MTWEGFRAIKTVLIVEILSVYHERVELPHEPDWNSLMNTNQTLLLQALKVKQINTQGFSATSGDLIGQLIEGQDDVKVKMKNICAFISPELFNQVEDMGQLLDLSKRQIVEMALVDFLDKANSIIQEVDVFEGVQNLKKEA